MQPSNILRFLIRPIIPTACVALSLLTLAACRKPAIWSDTSSHKSGFVTANGIRLHYLDWGGSGPVLILIHGRLRNAHVFDDLAPAFTDRFRVLAYDRRGHGRSNAKEPYDTATLTEDLRGLMDGLDIAKAHLAGWSIGGNEITAMAGTHPERVDRIVYLEGAYDWGDPALVAGFKSLPHRLHRAGQRHDVAGRVPSVPKGRVLPRGKRAEPIRSLCSRLGGHPIRRDHPAADDR